MDIQCLNRTEAPLRIHKCQHIQNSVLSIFKYLWNKLAARFQVDWLVFVCSICEKRFLLVDSFISPYITHLSHLLESSSQGACCCSILTLSLTCSPSDCLQDWEEALALLYKWETNAEYDFYSVPEEIHLEQTSEPPLPHHHFTFQGVKNGSKSDGKAAWNQ